MEIQTLGSNEVIIKDYISTDSILAFNLPGLISSMKLNHNWAKKELNAMILLKGRNKQIILTAIHDGTEIESFQSKDSITFHILEGKLEFHTSEDVITLNEGQLMSVTKRIKYRLTTDEDTIFLLTVSDNSPEVLNN